MDETEIVQRQDRPQTALRRGWTTGACATAATKAALTALMTGKFPDPVSIRLPKGETPHFALAIEELGSGFARAGIVKDAGDDPDVTHGATVVSTVRQAAAGSGISFIAGEGVGTVTKPGLPVGVGQAAINPVPRAMMSEVIGELCVGLGRPADIEVTISVPGGAKIAERTWNPRLGIVGGISILGTTGIVHPFSCSAWIHSIRSGIDVARATGIAHVLAATGSTSETAARRLHTFPDAAILDMGDFAGGLLKYLRDHPIPRLTVAGGFAKLAKLAQGALDLHSARSQVNMEWLAAEAAGLGLNQDLKNRIQSANSALEALDLIRPSGIDLPLHVARGAIRTCRGVLRDAPVAVEVVVVSRDGTVLARADEFRAAP